MNETPKLRSETPVQIAVDALGGYTRGAAIDAVATASREHSGAPVYFTLVGDEVEITRMLHERSHNPERIQVVHAPRVATLGLPIKASGDELDELSIAVACQLVADGYADAIVSAGHPGAAILGARRHFTLLEGIERAALAAVYPTPRLRGAEDDPFSLILDVGASVNASAQDLVGFARLGSDYARKVSRNPSPRVALLSNSREPGVGPDEVIAAHAALRERDDINFIGNIEGHAIPSGAADVIVCSGFVGDVALKILEGIGDAAVELARSAYERKFVYRQGLRLLSGGLSKLKRIMDFEEYGGAPLLGFEQLMILSHPRSQERAIGNAIKLAIKNVR
jgi:glycerol-3-phosphate acyltransferase PlsX